MERVNMEKKEEQNRKELSEEELENISAAEGWFPDLWYWARKIGNL